MKVNVTTIGDGPAPPSIPDELLFKSSPIKCPKTGEYFVPAQDDWLHLMMDEHSWTGVILAYICPACDTPGRQMFALEGGSYDNAVLNIAAARMTTCTRCRAPLPKGLTFETDICVAPLEQLRKAGYPVPSVN